MAAYDLNTVAFEGGNGFYLERPGRVIGARVKWDNLAELETATELYFLGFWQQWIYGMLRILTA